MLRTLDATGDIDQLCAAPNEVRSGDELGLLAAALASMAADLKDKQDKLFAFARALELRAAGHVTEQALAEERLAGNIARETSVLTAANAALMREIAELRKRNDEIALFSRMTDFLQTSATEAEAYSIISESVAELFPQDSGAVFALGASRQVLEAVAVWGSRTPSNAAFPANECWAYRRGQLHLGIGRERWCPHVTDDGRVYMCLPLLAQGEMLGILYLHDAQINDDEHKHARAAEKCRLGKILADAIGLGISNLKLREAMRTLSTRDALTGLFNRRYMEEALQQELHRSRRNSSQLVVVMIDTDHFKQINEDFGHDGGDAVLRALGAFFKKHVRGSDVACRYGGDEFILILSPSVQEGALQLADKIRAEAQLLAVTHAGQNLGPIALSVGVAVYPDHGSDAAEVLKAADIALFRAKSTGRNRTVVFEPIAAECSESAALDPPAASA